MYALGYLYYLTQTWNPPKHRPSGRSPSTERPAIGIRIGAALRRVWLAVRRRQVRGSTERTLRRMSDWTLRDIGISRAEIPEVAAALARGNVGEDGRSVRPAAAHAVPQRRAGPVDASRERRAAPEPVGCG